MAARRLKKLYREIADLTNEVCAKCDPPFACCASAAPLGCGHTKFWAKAAWGVELKEQQDGELPFLTASGCSVNPHLRPVCTIAVCRPNALPQRYYDLLREIAQAEQKRWQTPAGQKRKAEIAKIYPELTTNPFTILEHLQGTDRR